MSRSGEIGEWKDKHITKGLYYGGFPSIIKKMLGISQSDALH